MAQSGLQPELMCVCVCVFVCVCVCVCVCARQACRSHRALGVWKAIGVGEDLPPHARAAVRAGSPHTLAWCEGNCRHAYGWCVRACACVYVCIGCMSCVCVCVCVCV